MMFFFPHHCQIAPPRRMFASCRRWIHQVPPADATPFVSYCVASTAFMLLLCVVCGRRSSRDELPDDVCESVVRLAVAAQNAAQNTQDSLVRWQELATARAYIAVARQLASDAALERASRIHVRELQRRIASELQQATVAIHNACPRMKPVVRVDARRHVPKINGTSP